MKYRSEIDGLRAVAVVPVILFHAGFEVFSGGYVGVDVFFVISGFLITSIILAEQKQNKFTVLDFYERRARRIIPALAFVVLCCVPAAWIWLMPDDLRYFGGSVAAVGLFVSNFWFWEYSGYFDGAAELKPLLHTWSLAVEEQYYLLFPLLLMLGWRLGVKKLAGLVAVIALASLGLSEWGAHHHPQANFYLLPYRAWELLIGSLVAFYLHDRPYPQGALNQALSLLGLLLIGFAIFTYDETTPFPGIYALAPTLGTVLFILFGTPGTVVAKLLSNRLMVGIGLISYSAYLWHHPLFAFARIGSMSEPSALIYLVLSLLSLGLAYLSWRFVERPFRNPNRVSRRAIFAGTGLVMLAMIAFGVVGAVTDGFTFRVSAEVLQVLEAGNNRDADKECKGEPGNFITPDNACIYGADNTPTMLLYGDSHAWRLRMSLGQAAKGYGISVKSSTYVGCVPALGLLRLDQGSDHRCVEFNERVHSYLQEDTEIEYVIVMGRWALATEGERFNNREGGVEHGRPVLLGHVEQDWAKLSAAERRKSIASSIVKSIQSLLDTGKTVILVYPVPEVGWDVPDHMAKLMFNKVELTLHLSTSYELFRERNRSAYAALDSIGEHPRLIRIKPEAIFCDSFVLGRCVAQVDRKPLYTDSHHLSDFGARLLVKEVMSAVTGRTEP